MKFKLSAQVTVSCWTTVEADTLEDALKLAEDREMADLCRYPFSAGEEEAWHFSNDGTPRQIVQDT